MQPEIKTGVASPVARSYGQTGNRAVVLRLMMLPRNLKIRYHLESCQAAYSPGTPQGILTCSRGGWTAACYLAQEAEGMLR